MPEPASRAALVKRQQVQPRTQGAVGARPARRARAAAVVSCPLRCCCRRRCCCGSLCLAARVVSTHWVPSAPAAVPHSCGSQRPRRLRTSAQTLAAMAERQTRRDAMRCEAMRRRKQRACLGARLAARRALRRPAMAHARDRRGDPAERAAATTDNDGEGSSHEAVALPMPARARPAARLANASYVGQTRGGHERGRGSCAATPGGLLVWGRQPGCARGVAVSTVVVTPLQRRRRRAPSRRFTARALAPLRLVQARLAHAPCACATTTTATRARAARAKVPQAGAWARQSAGALAACAQDKAVRKRQCRVLPRRPTRALRPRRSVLKYATASSRARPHGWRGGCERRAAASCRRACQGRRCYGLHSFLHDARHVHVASGDAGQSLPAATAQVAKGTRRGATERAAREEAHLRAGAARCARSPFLPSRKMPCRAPPTWARVSLARRPRWLFAAPAV
eukprot:scaffold2768_cov314-Prasinococcus_capsulatus_cf.AAC.11